MKPRTLLLRLHLVIGLLIGGAVLVVGLSGVVLVFRDQLEGVLHRPPGPPASGAPASLQALVEAARRRHPGARAVRLVLPERADRASRVAMIDATGEVIDVLVDPASARVLASRWEQRSPFHALRLLHAELYMGRRGSLVVMLLGVGLLVQSAIGLYLWWPFLRRPERAFTIRRRRPFSVVSYDVHKAVGVLSLAFNVPVAVTGALLAFAALASAFDAPPSSPAGVPGRTPLSLDAIAASADAALPGGVIDSLILPRGSGSAVSVRKRMPGEIDTRGASFVLVDQYSGDVLGRYDSRHALAGRLWALVAPLHFGGWGGTVSKLAYAAGGLTSALLVVTGLVIWIGRPRGSYARALAQGVAARERG